MQTTIRDPERHELYARSLEYDAALDAEGLSTLWHPEGSFQIGAMPRVTGRDAIRGFFANFFSMGLFTRLEHEMAEVWDMPDVLVYRATAIYTRPDGSELRLPYVNVVRYREGLFSDYQVFVDTKPLTG